MGNVHVRSCSLWMRVRFGAKVEQRKAQNEWPIRSVRMPPGSDVKIERVTASKVPIAQPFFSLTWTTLAVRLSYRLTLKISNQLRCNSRNFL